MSANDFVDACGFIPSSGGTGNFVVSAAVQGYQTPAAAGAVNGNIYSYRAESADRSQWEEGFGAYTSSSTTLARTTITANSSAGTTAFNFSAAPNVYITAASADLKNAAMLVSGTLADARLSGNICNLTTTSNFLTGNTRQFTNNYGATVLINSSVNGKDQFFSNDGGPAFHSFIRNGVYAINIGLDINNNFVVGGWSDGSMSRFYADTSGNLHVNGAVYCNSISPYTAGAVGATNTAKAFASWVGSTGAIRGSAYNISSVTRTGAGSYTVNFANALPDTNYAPMGGFSPNGVGNAMCWDLMAAPTSTSSFNFRTINSSGVATDTAFVTFAVFGI